jgi:hypothetical protein
MPERKRTQYLSSLGSFEPKQRKGTDPYLGTDRLSTDPSLFSSTRTYKWTMVGVCFWPVRVPGVDSRVHHMIYTIHI